MSLSNHQNKKTQKRVNDEQQRFDIINKLRKPNPPSKEQDEDEELSTLRKLASQICKSIDIGTAILPKPLFTPDYDDIIITHGEEKSSSHPPMENATIETVQDIDQYQPYNNKTQTTTTRYSQILSSEFNAVVIEHHLKWGPLCQSKPGPIDEQTISNRVGRYDFSHVDAMVDWAISNNMKVKGHVLVWHVTTPDYIESMSADGVRDELKRHIFTTMGHFRGRIKMWDVVNEALAPNGSLANNVFLRKLGPSYIEQCFRWAHEADPSAFLIYNDNKVEGMDGPNKDKSDGFYKLLQDLVNNNVPIHGAGIQAHFDAAGTDDRKRIPTPTQIKNQIHRIGLLGLKVNISEMDVRVSKLPKNVRAKAQRQIYHDVIAAALTEPSFDGIWLWGFTDRHTWVKNFYHDDNPLIFDHKYNKKDSYYGLYDAIATMAVGGKVGGEVLLTNNNTSTTSSKIGNNSEGAVWGSDWRQNEGDSHHNIANEGTCSVNTNGKNRDVADVSGDARPDWAIS